MWQARRGEDEEEEEEEEAAILVGLLISTFLPTTLLQPRLFTSSDYSLL